MPAIAAAVATIPSAAVSGGGLISLFVPLDYLPDHCNRCYKDPVNSRTRDAFLQPERHWLFACHKTRYAQDSSSDGSPVVDDFGNRKLSTDTSNRWNQYIPRSVPGYLWELGSAVSNATVTIHHPHHGESFAGRGGG